MADLVCTQPLDACGRPTLHPDCKQETVDQGLGPGRKHVIQTKWVGTHDNTRPLPDVWLFVEGYQPVKLENFVDGATFTINWDLRRTLQNGTVRFGLNFKPTDQEQDQGFKSYWIFSNDPTAHVEFTAVGTNIVFTDAYGDHSLNPFEELAISGDHSIQCWATAQRQFGICIYECCPIDCFKPYDNTLFCAQTFDESAFSLRASFDPGLAKQTFLAQGSQVVPIRGLALTRSADAYDSDLKLLYGSQQWVMVWDLELNKLIDFFPKDWLRFGAAAYYQQATLRKDIKAGKSSRKPYYIEVVDLGLTHSAQGSFDLDRDQDGQRSTNWDVPSRLISLSYQKQQRPEDAFAVVKPMDQQLAVELNQVSIDRYREIVKDTVQAQRERFFQDRTLFLDHTARQRFHDQIMFLTREVAEKTLRLLTDQVEQAKNLVDSFNPDAQDGFGYYLLVVLNLISNKMVRSSIDLKSGPFAGTELPAGEETASDWTRSIYGEIRRLVELTKTEKKDVQAKMLEALFSVDPSDPNAAINAIKKAINFPAVEQAYELAAEGDIPPASGIVDPDTKAENEKRGLSS